MTTRSTKQFRELIAKTGKTHQEIADATGYALTTIKKLSSGDRIVQRRHLLAVMMMRESKCTS